MKKITINQRIKAPAEKVWAILRTGKDLDKWLPMIATCKLEGEGAGAKRTCTTGDGKTIKETILAVDDVNRAFSYRIDEQDMLPTRNYSAKVVVTDLAGESEIHWSTQFEMTAEEAYPEVEKGLKDMLHFAISSLESAARM